MERIPHRGELLALGVDRPLVRVHVRLERPRREVPFASVPSTRVDWELWQDCVVYARQWLMRRYAQLLFELLASVSELVDGGDVFGAFAFALLEGELQSDDLGLQFNCDGRRSSGGRKFPSAERYDGR